jgi:nitrogen fixation NifU-like protein
MAILRPGDETSQFLNQEATYENCRHMQWCGARAIMETEHPEHLDEGISVIPSDSRFWRHAREPQNLGSCRDASASAVGIGSCGDKMKVEIVVKDDLLVKVQCVPEGCVYTVACASAMSVLATGCRIEQALQLQPENVAYELGGLPADHSHCARLAINTLGEAIAEYYRKALSIQRGKKGEAPEHPSLAK